MHLTYHIAIIPSDKILSIMPLVKILNPGTDEIILKQRLDEMLSQGYECAGVYDGDILIGICGIWIITKLYVGKHLEPDNVIIHPDYRNKSIGELLMQWIYDYGRSKGCIASELNCYLSNPKGQKFWFNEGYTILGFHYQKKL